MEGLRWPDMVFGIFGALVAFVCGILDIIIGNRPGGISALAALIILCAISAMTPSLPGWSTGLFVAVAFVFFITDSTAVVFAGPLLVIAAVLAALAAWSRKRQRDSTARVR